uniref:K Homology domain-containing protein n=1 Tax=Lactuca sativa TaxID=4236 RepID=A0A9R1X7J4_LACSA|nr:hypothetical protein LSAT_V11C600307050 [Lactuca sativa]
MRVIITSANLVAKQNGTGPTSEEVGSGPSQPLNGWGDVEQFFGRFDDQQWAAIHRERSKRMEEQKKMFANRRLCLVLELDQKLLNSTKFRFPHFPFPILFPSPCSDFDSDFDFDFHYLPHLLRLTVGEEVEVEYEVDGWFYKEIVFRILYSSDKVGSLIGKSGTIIQAIQNESGAHIAIRAPVSDCDERLITISAMESAAESQNSASQNAVILIFNRSVESGFQKGMDMTSSSGAQVSTRLVISQNQMGCLLGKGGSIVAYMTKMTGAFIKIVGDHQVPKCAPETDQVVLMTGEMINVRDALYSVTGRLRNNLFSNRMSNNHGIGTRTTKGTYTQHQSSVAMSHYPNQHNTNLTQAMDNLKLSSSSIDRPLTPGKWHLPMGQDICDNPSCPVTFPRYR